MKTYKQYQPFTVGTPLLARADGYVTASPALHSDLAWFVSNINSIERHGKRVRVVFRGDPNGPYLERVIKAYKLGDFKKRDNDRKKIELVYNDHDPARKAGALLLAFWALSKDYTNVADGQTYTTTGQDVKRTYRGTVDGLSQDLEYLVKYDPKKAAELAETSKKNAEAASAQAQADNLNEQTKRSKAVRLTALIATGVLVAGIVALVIVNLTKK